MTKKAYNKLAGTYLPILFLMGLFLQTSCQSNISDDNWLSIPIEACIKSNERIVDKSKEVDDYCNCMIPRIYELIKDKPRKVSMMKQGKLDFLITDNDPKYTKAVEVCLPENGPPEKMKMMSEVIDARMEKGIRLSLKDHHDKLFKAQHDFEAYCDCFMKSLKEDFTYVEYKSGGFPKSEKYAKMKATCKEKTRVEGR